MVRSEFESAGRGVAVGDAEPELSVVMPVWNEGERVTPTLRAFAAAVHTPYELALIALSAGVSPFEQ